MPLTKRGRRVLRHFEEEYPGRGKSVFYATLRSHPELYGMEGRNPRMRMPAWLLLAAVAGGVYVMRRQQGFGAAPQPQNPTRLAGSPQLPASTINATYPADTQTAFAAYPRSIVLQGTPA